MAAFSRSFSKPRTSEDFESYCRSVLKEHWPSHDIQKNARRGQKQNGVDLYGHTPNGKLNGAQCKLHEEGKDLTREEVLEEVEKAKTFTPPLSHYVIATTAPTDPALQQLARELTQAHQALNLFSVQVMSWDDITEILNEYPTVARRLEGAPDSTVVIQSEAQRIDLHIANVGADHHAEIDRSRDLILKGEISVALAKLDELRTRMWDALSKRERYRVLANTGHAYATLGEFDRAGRAYVDALSHQPDDPEALSLGAVGFKYLQDSERARELAMSAHKARPDSSTTTSVWVSTRPDNEDIKDLEKAIPAHLLKDHQVALAVARRFRDQGDLEGAEKYARIAIASDPDWVEAREELASTLLETCMEDARRRNSGRVRSKLLPKTEEATKLLVELVRAPVVKASKSRSSRLRLLLAMGCAMGGDQERADREVYLAYEESPDDPSVRLQYAVVLRTKGKTDEAIELFRSVSGEEYPSAARVLAEMLKDRGLEGDKKEAATVLEAALSNRSSRPDWFYSNLAEELVLLRADQGLFEEARATVASLPEGVLTESGREVLLGAVDMRAGTRPPAHDHAVKAKEALSRGARPEDHFAVAGLFSELGMDGEALGILKSVVGPEDSGVRVHELMRCAEATKDHGFILEFARRMRKIGNMDPRVFALEIRTLETYNSREQAIEAVQAVLATEEDKKRAQQHRLCLSVMAFNVGHPQLMELDPSKLPSVEDVVPSMGRLVAWTLRRGGKTADAASYAYRLVRRYPDSRDAQLAMLISLGFPGHSEAGLEVPESVQPGVAFFYESERADESRWYVIETEGEAKLSLGEIAPEHPLAVAAIGKSVGSEVVWNERGLQTRRGRIANIVHRFHFRWQDIVDHWFDRFPDFPLIEPFRLPLTSTGEVDLTSWRESVREVLGKKESNTKDSLAEYEARRLTLHLLGRRLGVSALEAQIGLAEGLGPRVQASVGTQDERQSELAALRTCRGILLDVSALGTLIASDLVSIIESCPVPIAISEGTLLGLRFLIHSAPDPSMRGGTLLLQDDEVVSVPIEPEVYRRRLDRFRDALSRLERVAQVMPGESLARVALETREKLVAIFGRGTAETLAIAADNGFVVWADEAVVGIIGRDEMGAKCAWTQAVAQWFADTGRISGPTYLDISVELLARRYAWAFVTEDILIRAAEKSDWDPDKRPLSEALPVLSGRDLDPIMLGVGVLRLLVKIRRQCKVEMMVDKLEGRILDIIGTTLVGRRVIQSLDSNLDRAFGVNVVGAAKARNAVRAWIASRKLSP